MVKKKTPKRKPTAVWLGFDISMSSIAGAGLAFDHVLNRALGPVFTVRRWQSSTPYYDRLEEAALGHEIVFDLISALKVTPELHEVFIGVEEPWPFSIVKRAESGWLKQQAEINGAFKGGLLRYGYGELYEINNISWKQIVAAGLGITTHHSKWNPNGEGKFRAKQWAIENYEVPEFPDLIHSKDGLKPKPPESKAKPAQSDDRYEALAMAVYMKLEWERFSG